MQGKLYLCATPIGNLDDITLRVLNTLKTVDLIAAEDTRHSIKLLNHFDIKTPMTSYHEYNKIDKARYLVDKMKEGLNVALITDAGTPGISDPGEELVKQCYEAGVELTSLPGPAACVTALTISGMATRRFCFEAFLPTDKKEKQWILEEHDPKGECVIVLEGRTIEELKAEGQEDWKEMPLAEHMEHYLSQGKDKKEAMKLVAKDRGISKRDVYQQLLEDGE